MTTDAGGKELIAHWDGWRYRQGGDVVSVQYGKKFNEGKIPDAKAEGVQHL